MDSTAKDKFDACIALAEHFSSRHDARRSYEWKIAFGVWSLLAAACHYMKGLQDLTPCMAVLIVAIFEVVWAWNIWRRNLDDRQASRHYRTAAEQILCEQSPTVVKFVFENDKEFDSIVKSLTNRLRLLKLFILDWAALFQGITTTILVIALYHFNHLK